MKIPFSILFAVILSLDTFAAPVPTAQVRDEFALEVRKAKAVAKKPAKAPPKPKPAPKAPVKKPVAKPVAAKKPVAKKPVAKKPVAKKPVAVKPVAKKPVAKKPVAVKPVAKKPVAKAPTKTTVKAPAKAPVKSAKPAAKPAASACPIKPAAKKPTKPKRMLNALTTFAHSFTRKVVIARRTYFGLIQPRLTSGNEFVGWHGTNEETAALWEKSGEIVRPTTKEGQTKGKSGLDAELGPGLYISDTLSVAEAAAAINAQTNKLAGKVCAIFAKSSSAYRSSQDKVQIPEIIRGNANIKEQERASYITNLPPAKKGSGATLRLGPLTGSTNQMLIPESQNPKFEAQCFDIVGLDSADAAAFEKSNGKITYTSASLISQWKIRKEDSDLAKATVAAFEKKCP